MSRTMTQEERYRMMTEKPVSRLIPGVSSTHHHQYADHLHL